MRMATLAIAALFILNFSSISNAQIPSASEHHKILKQEAGQWMATTRLYMGPAGPTEEPFESTGKETGVMIGDFWIVSTFEGTFGGMPFKGNGTFGYDEKQKKYLGTWVDSFSSNATEMVGTYDEATKTMTYETMGVGMDGKPAKGRNVVVYKSDDERKMTMYMTYPGANEMVKAMEIDYKRAPASKK